MTSRHQDPPSLSPPILPECCHTVMVNTLCPVDWSISWPSGYARSSGPAQGRAGEERLTQWRVGRSSASQRSTELCRQLQAYPGFFFFLPILPSPPAGVWTCGLSAHEAQAGDEWKLSLRVGAWPMREAWVTWPLWGLSEEEVLIFYLEGHSLGKPGSSTRAPYPTPQSS